MENVVILGAGISGLTAAIYAARANLKPLVVTGHEDGGQLSLTTAVENFPGFPAGINGPELVQVTKAQAEKFGAVFLSEQAKRFGRKDSHFLIETNERTIETKTVIITTGASARMLGLESEKKYLGRGVSTCATCDGYFFRDKKIVVVGGGDSACEESLFLTKFASEVTIIHRRDQMRASKIMQGRVLANPKIKFMWKTEADEVLGDGTKVTGARVKNLATGKTSELACDGFFLAIGHIPNTTAFKNLLELDENGYLKADSRMRTKLPGIFTAGDVHDKIYKQAVTAAGMGCQAALEVERYLEGITRQ